MTDFRKLVEKFLSESDFSLSDNGEQNNSEQEMEVIAKELYANGSIDITDKEKRNSFFDYIYSTENDFGFDPDDLRQEGDMIYLA